MIEADPYLNIHNAVSRLVRDWKRHGKAIIAYDFDDTVYDCHGNGSDHHKIHELLKRCQKIGAWFIVSTCRRDDELDIVRDFLKRKELPYDTINENLPIAGFVSSKIYCNILLDDKAGLSAAYTILSAAADEMET